MSCQEDADNIRRIISGAKNAVEIRREGLLIMYLLSTVISTTPVGWL